MFILFVVLLACLSLAKTADDSFGASPDFPFQDPYAALRWTLSDTSIAQWSHLPTTHPVSLSTLSGPSPASLLLVASDSLWIGQSQSSLLVDGFDWERVDILWGIHVTPETRLLSWPVEPKRHKGDKMGGIEILVVDTAAQHLVICDSPTPSACRVVANSSVKIGNQPVLARCSSSFVLVGTDSGLWKVSFIQDDRGENTRLDFVPVGGNIESVTAVATHPVSSELCHIAIGTGFRLWVFDSAALFDFGSWRHFWVQNDIDSNVTALAFGPKGDLWIGDAQSVSYFDDQFEMFKRYGGRRGLPYGNITSIVTTEDRVFFGTLKGLAIFSVRDEEWSYMYGDRFIHGESILSLDLLDPKTTDGSGGVVILTDQGGSVVDWKLWTLEEKAAHYEAMVRPRHDRYGLSSDCRLSRYGDLTSYVKVSKDNDGLWTSIYLDAEIFRFATTKDPDAKKHAWRAFGGMELLNEVSGVSGFMARSILPRDAPIPGGEWFNSTVFPDLQFKGDTSSDEVDGHMLAFPLMFDLVAETPEEKARVSKLIVNIAKNIVEHDYYLLDYHSEKPTSWGVWNPKQLNGELSWANERGLGSMEMLGMCLNAYYYSGDELFVKSYRDLLEHGYLENILNTKIEMPFNVNHSDDELEWIAALALHVALSHLSEGEFDPLRVNLKKCAARSHSYVKEEASSMFDPIHAVITGSSDLSDAIRTLRQWPQELIDWPTRNKHRIDIRLNPEPYVRSQLSEDENMKLLPYNERTFLCWNGNPYRLEGGSGYSEADPAAWLFGYWMMRYYGFLDSPK